MKTEINVSSNVFCNSPWFELHVYWNGDYAFCCQQFDPPYQKTKDNPYNITKMGIREWYDSKPMREARLRMFGHEGWSNCSACWSEEDVGGNSRRHRSNQKSVIFQKQFDDSLTQSPHIDIFRESAVDGSTSRTPVDLHIDLGNYCNLACKMCWSRASSVIATQEKKWGTLVDESHLGSDWTKDQEAWNNFLRDVQELPIRNVHFMGGETVIQPRFKDFVDSMIDAGRTDIGISFVTNGTHFDQEITEKLARFKRAQIEVSIETVTDTNHYVRQGTDTKTVLANIDRYLEHLETVTVRPAINALTIRDFHTLLDYCLDKKLLVKGLIVTNPSFLSVSVLPDDIRAGYKENYLHLLDGKDNTDANEEDPNNYEKVVRHYAQMAVNLLEQDMTAGMPEMVAHMVKWDQVYGYDARELYPELRALLEYYGYQS